jgi:hypothetical protein
MPRRLARPCPLPDTALCLRDPAAAHHAGMAAAAPATANCCRSCPSTRPASQPGRRRAAGTAAPRAQRKPGSSQTLSTCSAHPLTQPCASTMCAPPLRSAQDSAQGLPRSACASVCCHACACVLRLPPPRSHSTAPSCGRARWHAELPGCCRRAAHWQQEGEYEGLRLADFVTITQQLWDAIVRGDACLRGYRTSHNAYLKHFVMQAVVGKRQLVDAAGRPLTASSQTRRRCAGGLAREVCGVGGLRGGARTALHAMWHVQASS